MTIFQKAISGEILSTPPIWMMRQAGRYHKHYQERRKKYSFIEMCKNPSLAAEVAMGPIEDFDFDVSILFSDLLFPLEALGMPLTYEPGPKLGWHLNDLNQINTFRSLEKALPFLDFQAEAVRKTREALPKSKSLIGFVGGPWTLFVYAVEGGHKGHMEASYAQIKLFKEFCAHMIPLLKANIQLQLNAGAEVVMMLDTAAGECAPHFFREHLLPGLKELSDPRVGYYLKAGTEDQYELLKAETTFSGFGYDHRFDVSQILKKNSQEKKKLFTQGNFNQSYMTLEPKLYKAELEKFLEPFLKLSPEERRGWICGVGHGLTPLAKEENVKDFVQTVRQLFKTT